MKLHSCFLLLNLLLINSLFSQSNSIIQPLSGIILLSGNFGELRGTHLHSGIDFRTGGKEGLPVKCVKDGYLARVVVSPWGYGHALYIEHLDGTTSVYAHLQRFNQQLMTMTRSTQYRKNSFALDLNVRDKRLWFRQGDIIGYSGNTGSSGGPHLHFELRETKTQQALNPLLYYKIVDNTAPVIEDVYIYGFDDYGTPIRMNTVKAQNDAMNRDTISIGSSTVAFACHIIDRMNGSANKLGIYNLTITVDGKEIYHFALDKTSFSQTKYINDVKVHELYQKGKTVYKCFGNKQTGVLGLSTRENGMITIRPQQIRYVSITATDINGNIASREFYLKGDTIPLKNFYRPLIPGRSYTLSDDSMSLIISPKTLLYTIPDEMVTYRDSLSQQTIYQLATTSVPLFEHAELIIKGEFEKNSVICELTEKGKRIPLKTIVSSSSISTFLKTLSSYVIQTDSLPPTITRFVDKTNHTLRFRVDDDLSGIVSYRGEVNGKWTLFTYDPKNKLLYCKTDEPTFDLTKVNRIVITLRDRVGNKTKKEIFYEKK